MNRLQRVNGNYYFRRRIPLDLICFFKVNEIKRSLKTRSIECAKILALAYDHRVEKLFMMVRCEMLDEKQIQELVKDFFNGTLNKYEQEKAEGKYKPDLNILEDPECEGLPISSHEVGCNVAIEEGMKALVANDLKYISPLADELLEEKKLDVERNSIEYKTLCREMLKAWIEVHRVEKERIYGRYENPINALVSSATSNEIKKDREGIPLSKAIKLFLDEKVLKKEFSEKTVIDSQSIFDVLLEVLGDVDIRSIDKEAAMKFADVVNRLPKNRNKRIEYKDKPISEVLKIAETMKEGKLLSDTSKAKYVERISMLMNWAMEADFVEKNYFKKLSVKHDDEEGERRPFTPEELMKMKNSPVYSKKDIPISKAHQFFIPLIALFTGMRMNEICQLYVNDIQEIQGIWCIDVNRNTADKKLKSKAARRTVPIHPVLVKAGLIKFKRLMEKEGHERLWAGLKLTKGTYKEQFSKWFARYCDEHITEDSKVVFHSFRNTLIDNLKQQGEQEALVAGIVGHEHPNITFKVYGQGYNPELFLNVLKKLTYASIFDDVKFPSLS